MPPKVIVNPEPVVVETTMDCDSDYEDYAMHEVVVPPVRVRIRHKWATHNIKKSKNFNMIWKGV